MPRKAKTDQGPAGGLARLVPAQQRSRERFEQILTCAAAVMAEKGSEAFRISDIVERTGIGFGSLYQYFPDKTAIIGTLAERYNAIGRDCVRQELSRMTAAKDLHATLGNIVDGYYQMFVDQPVMRDIWQATQADRALQKLDDDDGAYLARLLSEALRRVNGTAAKPAIDALSQLTMTMIAAAVRHAIALPPKEARRVLTLFKQMLPKDLTMLKAWPAG